MAIQETLTRTTTKGRPGLINKHRANALRTFQAFTKAASDDAARNAILMETTKSIFAITPTGYLDNETEAAIQRSLDVVSRNRTTIVIAHRLSTVRHADCIHLLENGRIMESGTHDALVNQGGGYAALWRLQTGERVAQAVRPV